MATTTAIIFIGHAHQNHSGINPTHLIQFTENSRPALIMSDIEGKEERIVIIPTLENTIDDIYLMISVYILKLVKPSKEMHNSKGDSLYEILDEKERQDLYKKTIAILKKNTIKVVINILDDSNLLSLIEQIKKYPNDYEITLPSVKKEFNAWTNKVESKGL